MLLVYTKMNSSNSKFILNFKNWWHIIFFCFGIIFFWYDAMNGYADCPLIKIDVTINTTDDRTVIELNDLLCLVLWIRFVNCQMLRSKIHTTLSPMKSLICSSCQAFNYTIRTILNDWPLTQFII